ncbi:hypothetical protein ACE193_23710 [Bernardetia sp. OM2101]|uniref:hypothetical protein n=1 Tax=Bernardetia sp. OM2101 TaxID=3344876 RepID=UPI0035D03395
MTHPILDTTETSYYAIFENLEYVEVIDIKTAFKQKPKPIFAIRKQNCGVTRSQYNEDFYAQSSYDFYNEDEQSYSIDKSNWKLFSVVEPRGFQRNTLYEISDPNNEKRKFSHYWQNCFQIEGIINVIKFIQELSEYSDWKHFDEAKPNSFTTHFKMVK